MNALEIRDLILLGQLIVTAGIALWMKFFYSELKQRDIKIDHIDERLEEVESNYDVKFSEVISKQEQIHSTVNKIEVSLSEVKQIVTDQKEFCSYVQEEKRKR